MADVSITYKGSTIATMDASGSKTLNTQGKYCEGDIGVEYVKPSGTTPTGTKQISITANGTTTEDVTNYASAEITVDVPSGWTTLDVAQNLSPSGRIEFADAITVGTSAFTRKPVTSVFTPNARLNNQAFADCTQLKTAVFKDCVSTNQLARCTALEAAECVGLGQATFTGCTKLAVLVLRPTSVVSLGNINVFTNTPFASGKAGGTLYVPSALISDYQSATNWSTILGYSTNSILPIEGSPYENYYVDGTPIAA